MKRLLGIFLALWTAAMGAGCIQQETPAVRELTSQEVEEVGEAFAQLLPSQKEGEGCRLNPLSHFFTSFYDAPQEIDLDAFLRYFPGEELDPADPEDAAQFQALRELEAFPFREAPSLEALPVPIVRKTAESVEQVLGQYAGISLEELEKPEEILYLKEYDSFYTYASDAGAGFFNCTGGKIQGGQVRLFSKYGELVLEERDGQYRILSHHSAQTE